MAVQRGLKPAPALIALAPGLVLLPLGLGLLRDLHAGGAEQIGRFWLAAFQPSLERSLLTHQLTGLQVTALTALLAWSLSSCIGLVLGLLCSTTIVSTLTGLRWPALMLRRCLSPLRSIHELVWGLLLLQLFGLNGWVAVLAIVLPYSALLARVLADQLDRHEPLALTALRCAGVPAVANLFTSLMPPVATAIRDHIGHRLDCALRSALLLGIFGLGGLGTELMFSMQSLRFRELWSGLWLMALLLASVNLLIRRLSAGHGLLLLLLGLPLVTMQWSRSLHHDLSLPRWVDGAPWPSSAQWIEGMSQAWIETPWLELVGGTLLITLLASGVAIALPPLLRLIAPAPGPGRIVKAGWMLMRLLPAPLTALLLMLASKPTIAVAALALGLHHSGVMGLVLEDGLERVDDREHQAMVALGARPRSAWLFGVLSPASKRYLAYAAYRSDVILRDTAVVGLVGGAGLGWQLMEALSSFHWQQVGWLVLVYAALTLLGELLCERLQEMT